ncbi:zinc finger domain-containing protein [Streptomyces sp. DSM 41634]|uniref:zinc finger domain-containing protein n=1 Tax=Streptomyces sp. DSM 41634 TaxID=3448656 RepID=UPI0040401186
MPHADRLQPVIDELQEQQKMHEAGRTVWRAYDVACPHCGQEAGAWCLTPGEPHSARSKQARKLTEQHKPLP